MMERVHRSAAASAIALVAALAAGLAGTLAGAGCSLVAIDRLREPARAGEVPACTASYGLPASDGVGAALIGTTAVTLLSTAEEESEFRTVAYGALAVTAVFLASATYGAHQVARCRRAAPPPSAEQVPADRPAEGSLGATCRDDSDCEGALVCDDTMHTCIEM